MIGTRSGFLRGERSRKGRGAGSGEGREAERGDGSNEGERQLGGKGAVRALFISLRLELRREFRSNCSLCEVLGRVGKI